MSTLTTILCWISLVGTIPLVAFTTLMIYCKLTDKEMTT